jgi:methylenetetrahydrofolate dehydrogenase (NADP+)/methenyltetrahydrofolate cyclohydrolase
MQIIDGRKIASETIQNLKSQVAALPFKPVFCDILVGHDPVSAQYVNLKAKKAGEAGMEFLRANFNAGITTQELVSEIKKLNQTSRMAGLIVQLPLPENLDRRQVLDCIDFSIDVDCMGSKRSAEFYNGNLEIVPPTSAAVMAIIDSLNLDLSASSIAVVGKGELVGKPVKFLLEQRGLKVSLIDRSTPNPEAVMRQADVIISATGKPKLIKGNMLKPGSVVIDAGTAEDGGQIVGDVDLESVKEVAGFVSPVPGGVGPVTVACLLQNVLKAALKLPF